MNRNKTIVLITMPILIFFSSLFIGRYVIDPLTLLKLLCSKIFFLPIEKTWTDVVEIVVIRIHLPRALLTMMVGAGLSISGTAFQGMFNNPLVSPYLLGISSCVGFGAALAVLPGGSSGMNQISSFLFGILAVLSTAGYTKPPRC